MTRFARHLLLSALLLTMAASPALRAQDHPADKDAKATDKDKPADSPAAKDKEESSVTDHTLKLNGQTIPYKATASTTLLKNEKDEPTPLFTPPPTSAPTPKTSRNAPYPLSTTADQAPLPFGSTWALSDHAAS